VDVRLETREYLSMTISKDHDIIDGAPPTHFALRLKKLLENSFAFIEQDSASGQITNLTLFRPHLCVNFAGTAVIEAAVPVEVDHIVEADYIADIAVKMKVGTAAELVDIADFSSPAA
jgi:hypothetical protein